MNLFPKKKTVEGIIAPLRTIADDLDALATQKLTEAYEHQKKEMEYAEKHKTAMNEQEAAELLRDRLAEFLDTNGKTVSPGS